MPRVLAVVTAVLLTAPAGFAQTQTSPVPRCAAWNTVCGSGCPGAVMFAQSDDKSGYAPTYYPGTPNLEEAQRVTIAAAETKSEVNMPLVPVRTARVSGTAIDSDGRPLAGSALFMTRRGAAFNLGLPTGGQVRPDGSFVISSVPPGEYTLQIAGGLPSDQPQVASITVTVDGRDVEGVQIVATRPSTITGRIVADAATAAAIRPASLRLAATPLSPDFGFNNIFPARINDDLGFELKASPGTRVISLMGPLSGLTVNAVRENGVDVTDSGFEVRPNEDLTGFEVELTTRLTEVAGLVTNARGEPATDYTAVVFAQDRDRWRGNGRYVRMSRSDQDGRFKVSGLPPGEYYATALDDVDPNNVADPDFLDTASARATRFSLADGETKALNLKLRRVSSETCRGQADPMGNCYVPPHPVV